MNLQNWPYYTEEQIYLAKNILKSGKVNYWTGKEGKEFENEFAKWIGSKFALTMANGTLSLFSAYSAIGINNKSEIITTPRSFIATASAAALLEAKIVFADVDRDSGLITPETIEPQISKNTKAISVVHLAGWPADMPAIIKLANNYNLEVIEDCAQAHGAMIGDRNVGSFGDISSWSFCQDKIITTAGEGGMVTTNKKDYYEFMCSQRDHGKSQNKLNRVDKQIGYRWLHDDFGFNFRLTEIQSAIGRSQLILLPEWNKIRTRNAEILYNELSNLPLLRIPLPKNNLKHAWYKFYVYLKPKILLEGWNRERIIYEINESGFPAFSGSCSELYKEKCFRKIYKDNLPNLKIAKELGDTSLMFLVHPTITEDNIYKYAEKIKCVLKKASKA